MSYDNISYILNQLKQIRDSVLILLASYKSLLFKFIAITDRSYGHAKEKHVKLVDTITFKVLKLLKYNWSSVLILASISDEFVILYFGQLTLYFGQNTLYFCSFPNKVSTLTLYLCSRSPNKRDVKKCIIYTHFS